MDSLLLNAVKKEEIKAKLIEFMENNNIAYKLIECCSCDRFCIDFSKDENDCKKYCCNSEITVITPNKDIIKIYPHEILYIAIENRKSVLYLINRKVETKYPFNYWKEILNEKIFAQPHNSYIVNLNHVDKVTNEIVVIKYKNEVYRVYTSKRKIGAFKKAFWEITSIKTNIE